jgi:hypothetical protein
LSVEDLARMMRSGLLDGDVAAVGLCQKAPSPRTLGRLRRRALLEAPELAMAMGGVAAKMALASWCYRRFPRAPERRLDWSRRIAVLFDMPADLEFTGRRGP